MSLKSLIRSFTDERWDIGLINNDLDGILNGDEISVSWIKNPYKHSWFADPFILNANKDEIIVLAEEFDKRKMRGKISKLAIDRKSLLITEAKSVLELDTHLSFPAIIRKDDKVFIYPENSEGGGLKIYELNTLNDKCELKGVICNERVVDAIQTDLFGRKLLFATKVPNINGNELSIFEWNDECYLYKEKSKVAFQENVARMAGAFFLHKGVVYRPSQECNVQYGHAVTLQQVESCNGGFKFNEVRRIYSVHPKLKLGCHTFNVFDDLIITDALGFDRPWIRRILSKIGINCAN